MENASVIYSKNCSYFTNVIKNIHVNFWCLLLFFILASTCNFFYLLPSFYSAINLSSKDFSIVLILICFAFAFLYIVQTKALFTKIFLFIELGTFILAISSSYTAMIHWGQPLWYGIRAQRLNLIYPILFLTYYSLYKTKKVSFKQIVKVFYAFSFIELFLSFIQVFVTPHYIFMNIQISEGGRFGSPLRLYLEDSKYIIFFCSFYSLDKFIRNRDIVKNGLFVVSSLLLLAFIDQSRMLIACFVFAFAMFILFSHINYKRKLLWIIVSIVLFTLFLFTSFGASIISLLNKTNYVDTSEIRQIGRQFYLDTLRNNPLFGGGFVNTDWEPSVIGSRMNEYIFANDNGVFGFLFYYGLTGMLYVILLYAYLIKKAYVISKKTKDISLIIYILFSLIGIYSIYSFGMSAHIGFPLLLILLEAKASDIKN